MLGSTTERQGSWISAYRDLLVSIALCLPFAGLYLHGVQRSVAGGDSAELVVAAYTLGIPHPTGYPIYTWIGKLFTLLPIGSVAYRVNLMSAVFGAATLAVVFLIVVDILKSIDTTVYHVRAAYVAGGLTILFLGLSRPFWHSALIAEVYTLNAFVVSLFVWNYLAWLRSDRVFYLYASSLILGLSAGTHLSNALIVPFFIVLVLLRPRARKHLLSCVVLVIIGASQYLYILLRAMQSPAYAHPQARLFESLQWTGTDNPFYNWLWFIAGGRWRGWHVHSSSEILYKLRNMAGWISRDYNALWLVLSGVGLGMGCAMSASRKKMSLPVGVVACQFLYYMTYRLSLPGMVLPLFACLSIFAGIGVGMLPHMLTRAGLPVHLRRFVVAGVLLFLIGFGFWSAASREMIDYSEENTPSVFFHKSVEVIPSGSILDGLVWEQKTVFDYYEIVEGHSIPFRISECDAGTIAAGKCFCFGRSEVVERYVRDGYTLGIYAEIEVDGGIPIFWVHD